MRRRAGEGVGVAWGRGARLHLRERFPLGPDRAHPVQREQAEVGHPRDRRPGLDAVVEGEVRQARQLEVCPRIDLEEGETTPEVLGRHEQRAREQIRPHLGHRDAAHPRGRQPARLIELARSANAARLVV